VAVCTIQLLQIKKKNLPIILHADRVQPTNQTHRFFFSLSCTRRKEEDAIIVVVVV